MVNCPYCKATIPDDSGFCDQCGKELAWCPECKAPKRGVSCPVCGEDLVPYSKLQSSSAAKAPSSLRGGGLNLELREGEFGRRGGIYPEFAAVPFISARHGALRRRGEAWQICDHGSTNGTFVAGKRLETDVWTDLTSGVEVRIANVKFTVS